MKQLKRKSSYNYTYFTTKVKENGKEIIADINKNADSYGPYYALSFCEPDDIYGIKHIKDIDTKFRDLESCKIYAECFIMGFLY